MKNRYDSEQTVSDIIDVATRLFTEKGFEKTSIQDIVNGLEGLTRGAIYHHFASKDEIMIAVIRKRLPLTDFYFEENLENEPNGRAKLQALLVSNLTQKMDTTILRNNPMIFIEMLRVNSEFVAPQVRKIIDEANRDGSLSIVNTKEVSEILMLLVSNWFNDILYPDTAQTFNDKIWVLKDTLDAIGLTLLDDHIIQSLLKKRD